MQVRSSKIHSPVGLRGPPLPRSPTPSHRCKPDVRLGLPQNPAAAVGLGDVQARPLLQLQNQQRWVGGGGGDFDVSPLTASLCQEAGEGGGGGSLPSIDAAFSSKGLRQLAGAAAKVAVKRSRPCSRPAMPLCCTKGMVEG